MQKSLFVFIVLIMLLTACSPAGNQVDGTTIDDILSEYRKPGEGEAAIPEESALDIPQVTTGPDCYQDGEHPIAVSIVEQFPAITTYEEVMVWFCNGAIFEDILNALTTEELTAVDADIVLHMIAEGKSWDEVWLELGVTEE